MHAARLLAIAAFAATLAACPQRAPHTDAAATPPPGADDAPVPTDTNFIHGRATYLERIKMPPGADFTVRLVDAKFTGATGDAIASTTLEDVAGPPYEFALQYDPAKMRGGGMYALEASLRDADGKLLFATDGRVPVTPGDSRLVEFRMVRAHAGETSPPPAQVARTRWTCGDVGFEAAFDIPGRRVELALPDGALSLPLARSASGARYADHRGYEFWTRGDAGTLTRAGGKPLQCVREHAGASLDGPWAAAKARGIAFRAVGNEPGWLVEIGGGEHPPLHAELDDGERKIDVAATRALSGLLGYAGTTADGARVRLLLERRACSDGMSDARYPVAATLEVGERRYQGCGRFLAQ